MTTKAHGHHTHERPHRHHYDAEMLSVEDARARILSYFRSLAPVDVPLLDALGLTLAEDLTASFDIPPLANSAMDGYAARAADIATASATEPVVTACRGLCRGWPRARTPFGSGVSGEDNDWCPDP